jgi:hypothetical protein
MLKAICLLLAMASTIAAAQAPGTATGTLTVNGKVTQLSYAQALAAQDWTFGADRKPVLVTVIKLSLSNASVEDQEDNFETFLRGREGKLAAVLLTFNAKGEAVDGVIVHHAFSNGAITVSGANVARFERKTFDDKTIAGKAWTEKSGEFKGVSYEFSAGFSASIQREPKPTVEGPAAAATGPGKAVQEFLRAATSQDLAALKAILRPEIAKFLEDAQRKQELMGLLAYSYPAGKQFTIARVFDFGNRAWVEALSKRPSTSAGAPVDETYRIRAVRVNDVWKVQPM